MEQQVKEKKGFFRKNEGILLVSKSYDEKQRIEDGLNREITIIRSTSQLIDIITTLDTDEGVNASVILTKETPKEMSRDFDDVVRLLEVTKVPVFEIGIGSTVKGAYRYNRILDFLKFAQNQKRKSQISDVKDAEQRTILEELQFETENKDKQIKELTEKIKETEKEMRVISDEYETLKKEVEMVYKKERDDALEIKDHLEEQLDEMNRKFENEKIKNEQYRREKDEALNELTDLKVERTSYTRAYHKKEEEIRSLKRELKVKEDQIREEIKEKEELFRSRVDSEEHVILSRKLEDEKKVSKKLEGDIAKLYVELNTKKFENERLEETIMNMREGEEHLENVGRTLNVDKYEFEKVDLIYIKVFEDLPYFRKATKMFYEKVAERYGGTSHLIILKHDDGMDGSYFSGVPLYSKVRDIPEYEGIVRMFPNPYIFTDAMRWERDIEMVMIIDYMKNDEYYATTKATERVMTMVRRYEDIENYGLKGSPIALDGKTVFDIGYDRQIDGSRVAANRERLLSEKVDRWVDKIIN